VWSAIEKSSKLHSLPHRQLTPVPLEKEPQLKDVCDRISRLYQQGGLEPIDRDILGLLEREVAYSPSQSASRLDTYFTETDSFIPVVHTSDATGEGPFDRV